MVEELLAPLLLITIAVAMGLVLEPYFTRLVRDSGGRIIEAGAASINRLLEGSARLDTMNVTKAIVFVLLTALPFFFSVSGLGFVIAFAAVLASWFAASLVRVPLELEGLLSIRPLSDLVATAAVAVGCSAWLVIRLVAEGADTALATVAAVLSGFAAAGLSAQASKFRFGAREAALRDSFLQNELEGAPLDLRWSHSALKRGRVLLAATLLGLHRLRSGSAPSTEAIGLAERQRMRLTAKVLYRLGMFDDAAAFSSSANERLAKAGAESALLACIHGMSLSKRRERKSERDGRRDDAIRALLESAEKFKGRSQAYIALNLAYLYWEAGDRKNAIAWNERVLQEDKDPRCPLALRNQFHLRVEDACADRADVKMAIDSNLYLLRRATREAQERMRHDPAILLFSWGIVKAAFGSLDEARRLFVTGIRLEDHAPCRLGLARILALRRSGSYLSARYQLYKVRYSRRGTPGRIEQQGEALFRAIEEATRTGDTIGSTAVELLLASPVQGEGPTPAPARQIDASKPRLVDYLRESFADYRAFFWYASLQFPEQPDP